MFNVKALLPIVAGTVIGAIVFNNIPRVLALLPSAVASPALGLIQGK